MIRVRAGVTRVLGQLSFVAFVMARGVAIANPPLDTQTANSLAEAQHAYQQHDFTAEIRIVKRLAERGVAEAQDE